MHFVLTVHCLTVLALHTSLAMLSVGDHGENDFGNSRKSSFGLYNLTYGLFDS